MVKRKTRKKKKQAVKVELEDTEIFGAQRLLTKLPEQDKKRLSKKEQKEVLKSRQFLTSSKKLKSYLKKEDKRISTRRKVNIPTQRKVQDNKLRSRLRYTIRIIRFNVSYMEGKQIVLEDYPEHIEFVDAIAKDGNITLEDLAKAIGLDKDIKRARNKLLMQNRFKNLSRWVLDIDEATYTVYNKFTTTLYKRKRFNPVKDGIIKG